MPVPAIPQSILDLMRLKFPPQTGTAMPPGGNDPRNFLPGPGSVRVQPGPRYMTPPQFSNALPGSPPLVVPRTPVLNPGNQLGNPNLPGPGIGNPVSGFLSPGANPPPVATPQIRMTPIVGGRPVTTTMPTPFSGQPTASGGPGAGIRGGSNIGTAIQAVLFTREAARTAAILFEGDTARLRRQNLELQGLLADPRPNMRQPYPEVRIRFLLDQMHAAGTPGGSAVRLPNVDRATPSAVMDERIEDAQNPPPDPDVSLPKLPNQ